ncbi:MAG: hypothetical protein J6T96_05115 [Bacteroidales bacterium]|nr:hypothetical protein [Bacteroidales bacterium]
MHKLYTLKDKLCDELSSMADQKIDASNLQMVDTLAHSLKNLLKVIDHEEGNEYSGRNYYDNGMRWHDDGRSFAAGRRMYSNRGFYSRDDDITNMIHEIRSMAAYLPANKQEDVDRLIMRMEQI